MIIWWIRIWTCWLCDDCFSFNLHALNLGSEMTFVYIGFLVCDLEVIFALSWAHSISKWDLVSSDLINCIWRFASAVWGIKIWLR
jgi:hypothetical protein